MLIDNTQTILVLPGCTANVFSHHVVIDVPKSAGRMAEINAGEANAVDTDATTDVVMSAPSLIDVDPVLLSVFGHRFMSIAEQVRDRQL